MIPALVLFIITYVLMLALQKYRPWIALSSAVIFIIMGYAGLFEMDILSALGAVDYNVLLMIGGTMGIVSLFVESKMPARLAEVLISKVPDVKWAVTALALFAGIISAFVDNVATVLMVAPIGLAISRKLKISPVPVLIAIAVSSNLQGAATLVGDTTSILLGGYADMTFLDFFWMQGKPGIFWGVEPRGACLPVRTAVPFPQGKTESRRQGRNQGDRLFPHGFDAGNRPAFDPRLVPARA